MPHTVQSREARHPYDFGFALLFHLTMYGVLIKIVIQVII